MPSEHGPHVDGRRAERQGPGPILLEEELRYHRQKNREHLERILGRNV